MDDRFRKDGPGSPGDLWTPILGPSVLLNMEGEGHLALRRKLMPLFTTAYVSALVADVLRQPLEDLSARLKQGETVDLVDAMRAMAGAVICRVIGLGEVSEARARELFEDGERVVSMVSLRSRRLSDRQAVIARRTLDGIGDIAQAAYEAGDESTLHGPDAGAGAVGGRGQRRGRGVLPDRAPRRSPPSSPAGRSPARPSDRGRRPGPSDRGGHADHHADAGDAAFGGSAAQVGAVAVRPGDRVLIVTHNCARSYGPFDPSLKHPPELRRLWFGAGPHFCIGYPLALAEIRAVASVVLSPPGACRTAPRGQRRPPPHLQAPLIRAA